MTLPAAYAWLQGINSPRIIAEALKLYGVKETPGAVNAPEIMGWARDLGLAQQYRGDVVAWCGLFVAIVVQRAGWSPVTAPLWARNWATFGAPSPEPGLGDVLVFRRESGGHVGIYIGEDATAFHVLGGNQGDSVSISRVAKVRLIAARRPLWRVSQPESVKRYHLAATGGLSQNEA